MYNYQPIANITAVLEPGVSPNCASNPNDCSDCSKAVQYSRGVNDKISVYTPGVWSDESSLSHLEDMCAPLYHGINNQNTYYAMTNAAQPGKMQRFLSDEEQAILCDLGYTVSNTFNGHTYPSGACGHRVVGINDGLSFSSFTYITNTSTHSVDIPITNAAHTGILDNDINASQIVGIEDVFGLGTVTILANNTIQYTSNGTGDGVSLIRYVPVDANGIQGNITYIYVYINQNCGSSNPCNMVVNGDFESVNTTSNCWEPEAANCVNTYNTTVDFFSRTGCNSASIDFHIPLVNGWRMHNSDTWDANLNNQHMIGITGSIINEESFYMQLTSPLIPGNTYTLKFWANAADANLPTLIDVAGSSDIALVNPGFPRFPTPDPHIKMLQSSLYIPGFIDGLGGGIL